MLLEFLLTYWLTIYWCAVGIGLLLGTLAIIGEIRFGLEKRRYRLAGK